MDPYDLRMIINGALGDAVRNNADWCEAMCRAHGLSGTFGPRAWTSAARTPLYYPDAVTLTEDADVEDVLSGIDRTTPGASVKDSYARLDLAAEGFRLLFEAQWITRPAGLPAPRTSGDWRPVRTPDELAAWALAWSASAPSSSPTRPPRSSPGTRTTAGSSAEPSSATAAPSPASPTSSPPATPTRPSPGRASSPPPPPTAPSSATSRATTSRPPSPPASPPPAPSASG